MQRQLSYIPGTLYDYIDLEGNLLNEQERKDKRKNDFLKNDFKEKFSKKSASLANQEKFIANNEKVFNSYLENFQEDLKRIIAKYRWNNHILSHEELLSEVNLSLLKKRTDLLIYHHQKSRKTKKLKFEDFRHSSLIFTRNLVRWSHSRICKLSFNKRRVDKTTFHEDEFKTTFELAVSTEGVEETFYEEFDSQEKINYIFKCIDDYCDLFSEQDHKVFNLLRQGLNQYEVSEKLGVTHQAISITYNKIRDILKSRFGNNILKDETSEKVTKGHESIDNFFNTPSLKIKPKDKDLVKGLLIKFPYQYNIKEINEKFLSHGGYTNKQVCAFINKVGLSALLRKKTFPNKPLEKKVLKMFKENVPIEKISKETKVSVSSLRGKRASFVAKGQLESCSKRKISLYK